MKRSRGFRSRTRRKLKRSAKDKFTITDYLREFKEGQSVVIYPNSVSQKSMPHSRFKGKIGKVESKRGNAYIVKLSLGNKERTIITKPEHLRPHKL